MTSDTELKAALMRSLRAMLGGHPWPLEVEVDRGMVTVSGQVDTHHTRFQVERAVRRVDGIRSLQLNIRPTQAGARRGDWQRRTLPEGLSRSVR
jgi:osmotically-inducible protein OsmY